MKITRRQLKRLVRKDLETLNETMLPTGNDLFGTLTSDLEGHLSSQFESFVARVAAESAECIQVQIFPPGIDVDQACVAQNALEVLTDPAFIAQVGADAAAAARETLGGLVSAPRYESKITRSQLRRIIREEFGRLQEEPAIPSMSRGDPGTLERWFYHADVDRCCNCEPGKCAGNATCSFGKCPESDEEQERIGRSLGMLEVTRSHLRNLIGKELSLLSEDHERVPEMVQFGRSKSGNACHKVGGSLGSAGERIRAISDDQTGNMRRVLDELSSVIANLSLAISSLGGAAGDESATVHIQSTPADLKRLIKMIQKLEQ